MSFLDWFFDPTRPAYAVLREELALAERQADIMREEISALARKCYLATRENGALKEWLTVRQDERDGLCRELWMARRYYDELRVSAAKDYQHLAAVAEMLRTRLDHAEEALKSSEAARIALIEGGASS